MASQGALEAANGRVLSLFLAGTPQHEIATLLGVSREAVRKYFIRHAKELQAKQRAMVDKATNPIAKSWLSDKSRRLQKLEKLYEDIEAWLAEHSLTETSYRYDKDGNEVGRTERFRSEPVRMLTSIIRQSAEELGQLPKPGDVSIHTGEGTQVLIVTPEPPLGFD